MSAAIAVPLLLPCHCTSEMVFLWISHFHELSCTKNAQLVRFVWHSVDETKSFESRPRPGLIFSPNGIVLTRNLMLICANFALE